MAFGAMGAAPGEADAAAQRSTAWGWISLLAVILLIAGGVRLVITPLQQAAQLDIGLSDVQIATLKGLAAGLPGFVFALPMGMAIDHLNRARVLLAMAVLWTLGAFMTVVAHDFLTLFVARALVSLGVGAALAIVTSMVADISATQKRGRVTMIIGIGVLAGPALAFAGGGALFGAFAKGWSLFPGLAPWRLTSLVFAVAGALLIIPILLLREPQRHEQESHGRSIMPAIRGLIRRWRFLLPLWIGGTAGGLAEGAAGIWAAPLLTRNYGLQPNEYGAWMGAMILIAGFFGSVVGGLAADWGQKSQRRGGLLYGSVIATVVVIPTAAYPLMPTAAGFGIMLGILMFACTITQVIAVTAITVLIPNEERGTCAALTGMAGTLVGLGAAPLIPLSAPIIFGDNHHLPHTLALIGAITATIGLGGYIAAVMAAPRSWRDA